MGAIIDVALVLDFFSKMCKVQTLTWITINCWQEFKKIDSNKLILLNFSDFLQETENTSKSLKLFIKKW